MEQINLREEKDFVVIHQSGTYIEPMVTILDKEDTSEYFTEDNGFTQA